VFVEGGCVREREREREREMGEREIIILSFQNVCVAI
jgi:hypothetical protein